MKKVFFFSLPLILLIFSACNPWPHGYYFDAEEASYSWRQGGAEPGDVYASQKGSSFCILKYDEKEGTKILKESVFAVMGGELDSSGVILPALFFKNSVNDMWSGMKLNGDVVVTNVEKIGSPIKI